MKVKEIKPRVLPIPAADTSSRIVRVAAYCRVSTDHEDQETSYEAQQSHFTRLIAETPGWELVDIYADEESGTRTAKRENFLRMIGDCEAGKVDLVLTKSISRFARNTLDCLQYIRKLKALNIPIIFTKENINTMDVKGELLTTIMASIAQQESASISQNVQMGVRYHYQEGKVCSGVHRLLGYNRTSDGGLVLVPAEAAVVRRIFREYLDGYSPRHIAERMTADGITIPKTTRQGHLVVRNWGLSSITYILSNEKYAGNLLLQKYYTVDFLTKKVAKNRGQVVQYYVENSHDPVVPEEVFMQVQAEMVRRKTEDYRYNHTFGLSGKAICPVCGKTLKRTGKQKYVYWSCPTRGCKGRKLREDKLHNVIVKAFNLLPGERGNLMLFLERLQVGPLRQADELLAKLKKEMEEDQSEFLQEQWSDISQKRAIYAHKEMQVRDLLERIDWIEGKGVVDGDHAGACSDYDEFFRLTRRVYPAGPVREYSEDDALRFVEKVVIRENDVVVTFRAGVEIIVPC